MHQNKDCDKIKEFLYQHNLPSYPNMNTFLFNLPNIFPLTLATKISFFIHKKAPNKIEQNCDGQRIYDKTEYVPYQKFTQALKIYPSSVRLALVLEVCDACDIFIVFTFRMIKNLINKWP